MAAKGDRLQRRNLDMSLDDIIRKRQTPRDGSVVPYRRFQGNIVPFGDVRNKLVSMKRRNMTDAREKLIEMAKKKDARQKLNQLRVRKLGRTNRAPLPPSMKNKLARELTMINHAVSGFNTDMYPMSRHTPRDVYQSSVSPFMRYAPDYPMEEEYIPLPVKPIVRSVNNEMAYSVPRRHPSSLDFGTRNPLKDKLIMSEGRSLKIVTKNDEARKQYSRVPDETIYLSDDSSNVSPVSILKKRPFGGQSNASSYDSDRDTVPKRSSRSDRETSQESEGFRIVVSNLQPDVTANDIYELFVDVGELVESRLVRPGTAEVIYGSLKDARKAVDVYHNRQLDGQPMKCFLVNPRTPSSSGIDSTKSGSSRSGRPQLPPSSNSSVEPDISTFHKVLFRKY